MNQKALLLMLILMVLVACGYGQYNEKQILHQQANQLLAQRQFAQAEQILIQVLDKYPNDIASILQLLQIYFALSQTEKAENLLNTYQRGMPPQMFSEQHIQLLILQAKLDDAWRESLAYLELYSYDESKYRQIASYFERKGFYEKALELYFMARQKLEKPELFGLEIANTSMNYRLFDQAVTEYLEFLDKNPANQFFVNNQMKIILQEDSTRIAVIAAYVQKSGTTVAKEIYANALLSVNENRKALEVVKQLSYAAIVSFAEEQAAAGNDSIAYEAYEHASSMVPSAFSDGLPYKMMMIRYTQADFSGTAQLITETLSKVDPQATRIGNMKTQLVKIYRLMAETKLALGEPPDSAKVWLNKALNLIGNAVERQAVQLDLAKLNILSSNFNTAEQILNSINETDNQKKRDFLRFLSALLSNQIPHADSLMNEYIIRFPASEYVNDAIYLMMLTLSLKPQQQQQFFETVKLLQLNQHSGLDSLLVLVNSSDDEELRLLAVEWAVRFGETGKAAALLDYAFADEVATEYAELLKILLVKDAYEVQNLAREFLKAKPNSIFSPDVRQRISRWATQRPNL